MFSPEELTRKISTYPTKINFLTPPVDSVAESIDQLGANLLFYLGQNQDGHDIYCPPSALISHLPSHIFLLNKRSLQARK